MPTKTKTNKAKAKPAPLPPGVQASDLEYPRTSKGERLAYALGSHGVLQFYETTRFGWCLCTLRIGGGGRHGPERYYAARVEDGATVSVGRGPHVTRVIEVFVREDRAEALKRYTDLHKEGLARAGTVRDRISSRRAQGAEERAAGHTSWRWKV